MRSRRKSSVELNRVACGPLGFYRLVDASVWNVPICCRGVKAGFVGLPGICGGKLGFGIGKDGRFHRTSHFSLSELDAQKKRLHREIDEVMKKVEGKLLQALNFSR